MSRWNPQKQGTVNIGVPTITGKQSPNPQGQELMIPPDQFVSQKGQPSPAKLKCHDRIKDLMAHHGMKRSQAIRQAKAECRISDSGDIGTISQKDVYKHKFQAEQPGRQMSPFKTQEQEFPFI